MFLVGGRPEEQEKQRFEKFGPVVLFIIGIELGVPRPLFFILSTFSSALLAIINYLFYLKFK